MNTRMNSHIAPPIDASTLLAVNDGSESPLRRAGVNVSSTHLSEGATADVKLMVFEKMMMVLQSSDTNFNFDLEALDVHRNAVELRDRAGAITEIADLTACSLLERTSLLHGLASGYPSRVGRKLSELAETVVEENTTPMKQQLIRAAAEHPFQSAEIGCRSREALELLAFPKITHTEVRQLQNAHQALDAIKNKQSITPPHLLDIIVSALSQRTDRLADESLASVCREFSSMSLRKARKELRLLTDECERFGSEFQRRLAAVRDLFDSECRHQHSSDAVSASSVIVPLPGPTESDLLASMISRAGRSDIVALSETLLQALAVKLSATADESYPHVNHQGPVGELLTRLPPDVTALAVSELVDQSIGTAHTAYSSIRTMGVRKLAKDLVEKAAVLVNLGGHQHENLHIQPIEQTLVRFPPRLGIDDEQTYLDLREAFSHLKPGCLFEEAGPDERDISCLRTLVGFPICVEETNDCLLQANATCAPHLSYLFGLLTDDGQPPADVRQLFHILSNE